MVQTVCEQNNSIRTAIKQGPGSTLVAEIKCRLPDLGSLHQPSAANPSGAAVTLTVQAELPGTLVFRPRLYREIV